MSSLQNPMKECVGDENEHTAWKVMQMIKKVVFLWNSTIEPSSVDVQRIRDYLARIGRKGLTCELIDTRDMPDEELGYWRKQALLVSVWRHQQIRQHFGASQLDLGKKVPALLVYEEDEKVPATVYPHTEKRGQEKTDYSIEAFLEKSSDSLGV